MSPCEPLYLNARCDRPGPRLQMRLVEETYASSSSEASSEYICACCAMPLVAFGCSPCGPRSLGPSRPTKPARTTLAPYRIVRRRPRAPVTPPYATAAGASTAPSGDADSRPDVVIRSLVLNLHGRDALPSVASLSRYMRDLRPKLGYLGPRAQERILSALEVANVAHEGQKRKSGEPFIIHPIAVAAILAEMHMDRDSIIAGLLHDTVEDTPFTLEEIEVLFGTDVRNIVEGETKISKLASKVQTHNATAASPSELFRDPEGNASGDHETDAPRAGNITSNGNGISPPALSPKAYDRARKEEEQEKQADNLRGMFLAMTQDVRVIIVKLADRLHNMRTLQHMKVEKQKKISKETLEIFAPLAHRLGMRRIKSELEELSFKYLYPAEYENLKAEVEALKRRARFDHYLKSAEKTLKDVLEQDPILHNMIRSVEVTGSTKELYGIYKRVCEGENLSSMLDLATLRVIVDIDPGVDVNQNACYHVLGRIHNMWKPLPKRWKDYIAFPKPNGYQSLHTTVLLGEKHDFFAMEIQIRTKAMHRLAEEGIAADLFQSSSAPQPSVGAPLGESKSGDDDGPLSSGPDAGWRKRTQGWLISIRDYIDSFTSSRDLVDAVRRDLLGNRVFVFTPKGRIIDLPKDATPVDLAYRIHTDVGHKMIGAKVNGRMVSLDHKLQNADVVKIIGSNSSPGPSSEWMGYAKSRTARQRIHQFLRARDRDNMIDRGRVMLESSAVERGSPVPSEASLAELIPRLSAVLSAWSGIRDIRTVDDLYISIAKGYPDHPDLELENIVLSLLRDRRHAVIQDAAPVQRKDGTAWWEGNGVTEKDAENGVGDMEESQASIESATCCHPVRGDEVMGIRSHDGGEEVIVVHRLHCDHLLRELRKRPISSNVVGLRWSSNSRESDFSFFSPTHRYHPHQGKSERGGPVVGSSRGRPSMPARVVVVAQDCDGLLSYVSGVLSGMGRSIRRAYTATDPISMEATLAFEVLVEDARQLQAIIERIERCDEVKSARRVGPNEGGEYFPPQLVRLQQPYHNGAGQNSSVHSSTASNGDPSARMGIMGGQQILSDELEIDELGGCGEEMEL